MGLSPGLSSCRRPPVNRCRAAARLRDPAAFTSLYCDGVRLTAMPVRARSARAGTIGRTARSCRSLRKSGSQMCPSIEEARPCPLPASVAGCDAGRPRGPAADGLRLAAVFARGLVARSRAPRRRRAAAAGQHSGAGSGRPLGPCRLSQGRGSRPHRSRRARPVPASPTISAAARAAAWSCISPTSRSRPN